MTLKKIIKHAAEAEQQGQDIPKLDMDKFKKEMEFLLNLRVCTIVT